ncbi:MAG: hypothetical protein KDC14_09205 [Planctomycetes bacterium]|nr:hypothetical protein [Planctomycetota bacterium]
MKTKSPSSTSSSELGSDREGLIALPDEAAVRTSPFVRWFVLLLFVVVSAGTGLTDTFFPAPRPRMALHQELDYEARKERAHLMDGSAARLFEYEQRLTSRVRRVLAEPYSTFLYEYLHEPSAIVIRGEDDWLFMRERTVPPARSDADLAGLGSAAVAALDRRVEGAGVPLVVVPIPRKSVLHADRLPRGIDSRVGLDRVIIDALVARGVKTVDLLRAFQERAVEGIYYPCDSHWSAASQLLAAEEIMRTAGRLAPEAERRTVVVEGDAVTPPGRLDLLKYMDVRLGGARLAQLRRQGLHNYTVEMREGPPDRIPPELDASRRAGRIAISGTSFSDGKLFSTYLAHYAQQPVLNGAMSAANFAGQLRELLLRRAEFPELELVLFEFPVHQLFFGVGDDGAIRLPDSLGLLLAELPPTHVEPLELAADFDVEREFRAGEFVDVGGHEPLRVAALPAGALFHTGDGIAALRVRGAAEGKRAMLEVQVGDVRMRAIWPEGATEVVLPLVFTRAAAERVQLFAHGDAGARVRVDELEVVLDSPGGRTRALELGAAVADGDGWTRRADFADPLATRRFAALVVDHAVGVDAATEFVVTPADDAVPPLRVATPGGAAFAIDLGALGGAALRSVEWRGSGPPPAVDDARGLRLVD